MKFILNTIRIYEQNVFEKFSPFFDSGLFRLLFCNRNLCKIFLQYFSKFENDGNLQIFLPGGYPCPLIPPPPPTPPTQTATQTPTQTPPPVTQQPPTNSPGIYELALCDVEQLFHELHIFFV